MLFFVTKERVYRHLVDPTEMTPISQLKRNPTSTYSYNLPRRDVQSKIRRSISQSRMGHMKGQNRFRLVSPIELTCSCKVRR